MVNSEIGLVSLRSLIQFPISMMVEQSACKTVFPSRRLVLLTIGAGASPLFTKGKAQRRREVRNYQTNALKVLILQTHSNATLFAIHREFLLDHYLDPRN